MIWFGQHLNFLKLLQSLLLPLFEKKNFLNFITNCLKFTNTFAIVNFNSKLEASIPSRLRQATCTRRLNQHPLNTVGSSVTSAKLVALILQLSPSRRGGARYGGVPSGQLQQRTALWPAQFFQCRKCYATQLYCMILVDWLWPLRNRAGHYILACGFFFFPRPISAVADWMSTIILHMVWP